MLEKHLLTGMALPRRGYKQKIDSELPKILTGWCLVRYLLYGYKQGGVKRPLEGGTERIH